MRMADSRPLRPSLDTLTAKQNLTLMHGSNELLFCALTPVCRGQYACKLPEHLSCVWLMSSTNLTFKQEGDQSRRTTWPTKPLDNIGKTGKHILDVSMTPASAFSGGTAFAGAASDGTSLAPPACKVPVVTSTPPPTLQKKGGGPQFQHNKGGHRCRKMPVLAQRALNAQETHVSHRSKAGKAARTHENGQATGKRQQNVSSRLLVVVCVVVVVRCRLVLFCRFRLCRSFRTRLFSVLRWQPM